MGEVICIVVAIIGGLIAYWLFGDADRADRISKIMGQYSPWTSLLLAAASAWQGIHALSLSRWIDALWGVAGFAIWSSVWFRARKQKSVPK